MEERHSIWTYRTVLSTFIWEKLHSRSNVSILRSERFNFQYNGILAYTKHIIYVHKVILNASEDYKSAKSGVTKS